MYLIVFDCSISWLHELKLIFPSFCFEFGKEKSLHPLKLELLFLFWNLFWNFCGRQFWCSSNINTRVKPVVFTVHGCATDVNHVCGTSFHRDSGDPDGFPAIANDGLWPQLQLHVLQHQSWWGGWRSVQPLPDPPRWWWCGWRAGGEGQSSYRVYYVKVRSLCLLWRKGVLYQTY